MIISLTIRPLYPNLSFKDTYTYIVVLLAFIIDCICWKLGTIISFKKFNKNIIIKKR